LATNFTEQPVDMQTLLPFNDRGSIYETNGTVTNSDGTTSDCNFTIENGAIKNCNNYSLQIVGEIDNSYIIKWTNPSETNDDYAFSDLDANGYTSWIDYLTDINNNNEKVYAPKDTSEYNLTSMTVIDGDMFNNEVPFKISDDNKSMTVFSCTDMDFKNYEFTLIDGDVSSKIYGYSYYAIPKPQTPQTQTLTATNNGWNLMGVGKDESIEAKDVQCSSGTLQYIWRYKNGSWQLYTPSGFGFGYPTFSTLQNSEGFWVFCE